MTYNLSIRCTGSKEIFHYSEVKHVSEADLAVLRKQVDIFISYRRSNGSQLASLLKVHLQLKGFKVWLTSICIFLSVNHCFLGVSGC